MWLFLTLKKRRQGLHVHHRIKHMTFMPSRGWRLCCAQSTLSAWSNGGTSRAMQRQNSQANWERTKQRMELHRSFAMAFGSAVPQALSTTFRTTEQLSR